MQGKVYDAFLSWEAKSKTENKTGRSTIDRGKMNCNSLCSMRVISQRGSMTTNFCGEQLTCHPCLYV